MGGSMAGRNVGGLDQTVRLAVGTALVMMWIFGPLGWWGVLGFLPLITGLTRVCPVYPLFGISTCPAPPTPEPAAEAEAPAQRKPDEAA
jgi:hypothetical protein